MQTLLKFDDNYKNCRNFATTEPLIHAASARSRSFLTGSSKKDRFRPSPAPQHGGKGWFTWEYCFKLVAGNGDDKHPKEDGLHDQEDRVQDPRLLDMNILNKGVMEL